MRYIFIESIIFLYTFLVISFVRWKKYMICWISFTMFSDLLPAFTCAGAIDNLLTISLCLFFYWQYFGFKSIKNCLYYFNPNLGGFFRGLILCFGGGGGITFPRLCLKLVRIMLETSNWHLSTQTYLGSENIPFSTKLLIILLMSAFFAKIRLF